MQEQEKVWMRPQDIPHYTLKLEDINQALDKYLTHPIQRYFKEDFLDESTGEVVTINRHELLLTRGTLITKEKLAELQFIMPAYDIQEITVADKYVNAKDHMSMGIYPWEVQICTGKGTYKLLLRAQSISRAILVAAEYTAMNFATAGFIQITKANSAGYVIIENTDPVIPQDDEEQRSNTYYRVTVIISRYIPEKEKYEHDMHEIIVKAKDVGQSKDRVAMWIECTCREQLEEHPLNSFRISKARPYDITTVVPKAYCELYIEDPNKALQE